ncbi:hypothetical protein [Pedobacter jeongneungensis]|uniref:hypothetical protein n=1 Tax=Pedobacter jeongneungensis TaxID=947309 RepID=UPI00046A4005|nr:hypothetical protein [Pedobacter jeongneungensis]
MKFIKVVPVIIMLFFIACESDETKFARAEKECSQKNSLDRLELSLSGYAIKDADSVSVKILRSGKIIADYKDTITKKFFDSLRLQRHYTIERRILLSDTLIIKIAGEPAKKIYGFAYAVNPHFTMMNSNWGCEFSSYIMDGQLVKDYQVSFINKKSR